MKTENKSNFISLEIHKNYQLLEGCVDVLCEEWGRSRTARQIMLEKSNDQLPFNIALVKCDNNNNNNNNDNNNVIGHSRLCVVAGSPDSAFVESVVIKKSLRGQGLGRILMKETEAWAKRLGKTTLYLTTIDKQDFYYHLGYQYCQPIISLGSASKLLSTKQFENLLKSNEEKTEKIKFNNKKITTPSPSSTNLSSPLVPPSLSSDPIEIPAPPPLKAPPPSPSNQIKIIPNSQVYWMKKILK